MFDSIWRGLAATIDSRFKGEHMLYEDHSDKDIFFCKAFLRWTILDEIIFKVLKLGAHWIIVN